MELSEIQKNIAALETLKNILNIGGLRNITEAHLENPCATLDEISTITVAWDKEIERIKNKHGFKGNYDLTRNLIKVIEFQYALEYFLKQLLSSSDIHKKLKKLMGAIGIILNEMNAVDGFFLTKINDVIDMVVKISGEKEYENTLWNITDYMKDTKLFFYICITLQKYLPHKKGGQKIKATRQYILGKLIHIFSEGTEKSNYKYLEVYNFIIDIENHLEQLGLALGEEGALGKDIEKPLKAALRERKKLILQLSK